MLNKEQILNADDLKTEVVKVPEWNGTVKVKTMTGTERDAFESSIYDDSQKKANLRNIRAKLCLKTIVNDKGALLFSESDLIALGKKSGAALDRVFTVAQNLNGLTNKDIEELEKNSVTGPSDASPSA